MGKIARQKIIDKLKPLIVEIKISQGHGDILLCSVDPPSLIDKIVQFLKQKFKAKVFDVRTPEDILNNLRDESLGEIEVAIWKFPPSPERKLLNTLNIHRERFYESKVPHVMLFTRPLMSAVIKDAPDFWSYRGDFHELEFPEMKEDVEAIPSVGAPFWFRDRKDLLRRKRIAEYLLEVSEDEGEKVKALMDLGYSDHLLGSYDEALEHFKKALELSRKLYGEMHPLVAESYNAIGLALNAKGEYDKAIEYLKKALEIDLNVMGESHPEVAKDYNDIGLTYHLKGEHDKAIEYFQKALEIKHKVGGEDDPEILNIYSNLGSSYARIGEHDKAIEYFQKALETGKGIFGEIHPFAAATYNNLGGIYHIKGEYDRAIQYYQKALEIFSKAFGSEHPYVARDYDNMGLTYKSRGELDKAIEHFNLTLTVGFKKNS